MLGKGLESLIPPNQGKPNPGLPGAPEPAAPLPVVRKDDLPAVRPAPAQHPEPVRMSTEPAAPRPAAQQSQRQTPAPQKPAQAPRKPEMAQESVFQIEVEKIRPNPDQPRRNFNEEGLNDLASSIREFGLLQPIVVTKIEKERPDGIAVEYEIIAGERRFLASKKLGLRFIPAIIRNVNLEREKLEFAVIENIQRENLNPIETARAFQRLQEEFRMTQREIAAKLGKSREVVANTVRLLDLPEYIRTAVEKGELSESHARFLIAIEDPGAQKRLFEDIIQKKLTTRDVKERVAHVGKRRGRPPLAETNVAPEVRAMQDELSSALGAPVQISKGMNTGRITITFYSEEELENILRRLGKEEG